MFWRWISEFLVLWFCPISRISVFWGALWLWAVLTLSFYISTFTLHMSVDLALPGNGILIIYCKLLSGYCFMEDFCDVLRDKLWFVAGSHLALKCTAVYWACSGVETVRVDSTRMWKHGGRRLCSVVYLQTHFTFSLINIFSFEVGLWSN